MITLKKIRRILRELELINHIFLKKGKKYAKICKQMCFFIYLRVRTLYPMVLKSEFYSSIKSFS